MTRRRADVLLVERGLADSRERARRLIMAGRVRSGTTTLVQPATLLEPGAPLALVEPERYVSRGGYKLEAALQVFNISPRGLVCLDVGASTGGFTDCLLQHGATAVVAVDVGRSQLHTSLRSDPRVRLLEGTNARDLPDVGAFSFFVVDVSFISLTKVLPSLARRAEPSTPGVVLVKPQFEGSRADIPRGGVIRDSAVRERIRDDVHRWLLANGWLVEGIEECPVRGGDGNVEYLVLLRTPSRTGE